jgi:hypothetical protein
MSQYNARLVDRDVLAEFGPAMAGACEKVSLDGAKKYSAQIIYDVLTITDPDFSDTDVDLTTSTLNIPNHGLFTGLKVQLSTDDVLPDPLLPATDYYVIKLSDSSIQLASSYSNAIAGVFIVLVDEGGIGATNLIEVSALSGASVTLQRSNDGINWINIQAATAITADGSVIFSQPNVTYRYFRAVKALTGGAVDAKVLLLVIGDAM